MYNYAHSDPINLSDPTGTNPPPGNGADSGEDTPGPDGGDFECSFEGDGCQSSYPNGYSGSAGGYILKMTTTFSDGSSFVTSSYFPDVGYSYDGTTGYPATTSYDAFGIVVTANHNCRYYEVCVSAPSLSSGPQSATPQSGNPCQPTLVSVGNFLQVGGTAMARAGTAITAAAAVGDAFGLLAPPIEAGTVPATAFGALVTGIGASISLVGTGVTYAGNHNRLNGLVSTIWGLGDMLAKENPVTSILSDATGTKAGNMLDKANPSTCR